MKNLTNASKTDLRSFLETACREAVEREPDLKNTYAPNHIPDRRPYKAKKIDDPFKLELARMEAEKSASEDTVRVTQTQSLGELSVQDFPELEAQAKRFSSSRRKPNHP